MTDAPKLPLETERLLLLPADPALAEAAADYYIRNREFLLPYEPSKPPEYFTADYQRGLLQNEAERRELRRAYRFYIAEKAAPDVLRGVIGLNEVIWYAFRSSFIGYKLDCEREGRGLMTEAVRRITRFAFDELELHRIEGNVMPRNARSLRVLEKCGFVSEGVARRYININGVWEDHVHMVLLNE